MDKLTGLKFAEKVLENAKFPINCIQIYEEGIKLKLDNPFTGKTPTRSLGAQLYGDIREKQENSIFMFASKRPTTFWLRSREDELSNIKEKIEKEQESQEKESEAKIKFRERDLHPLLVNFLNTDKKFNLHCKTIYHEKSSKSEKGKDIWDYPDIVGVNLPFKELQNETLDLLTNIGQMQCKIYSFELKIRINFSNLKESYFQAVSNSSWANEGYLVVFESIDEEVLSELERLNVSFGIGVIELDSDIASSKVLLHSKERDLDIQTLDMLVEKNKNFKAFVEDINSHIKAHSVKGKLEIKDSFDEVFDDDRLEKYCKEKHISKE